MPNKALHLTAKSAAPVVALLLAVGELILYTIYNSQGIPMNDNDIKGVVVNVLRVNEHAVEFLFLQRLSGDFKGQWWPVAGNCKEGESPVDSAIRELKEETGLDVVKLYELGKDIQHIDRKTKLNGYVALVNKSAEVQLNYEHSSYKWLSEQEAYELLPQLVHPYVKHICENFIESKTKNIQCVLSA